MVAHLRQVLSEEERRAVLRDLDRDPMQRELIGDLDDLMAWGVDEKIDQDRLLKIEKTRLNLLKMWGNT